MRPTTTPRESRTMKPIKLSFRQINCKFVGPLVLDKRVKLHDPLTVLEKFYPKPSCAAFSTGFIQ